MNIYSRETQQTIPVTEVKIVGVGGAGANILDRAALEGVDESSLLAVNTDQRTLNRSIASQKIQLGREILMGLGTGGDPDMGLKAAQETSKEIREALNNQKMVFICVGLGGGTGSGAAPLITRIAREQGAFVVVFAIMPFVFEGSRRREQAETALNELSVLANALITFDNGKMGELVLANAGIHDAFTSADVMISQSIKAVTRLIVQPGIVNIGLDDLVSALKATKSRCLFGSGIASGENRSQLALKAALNSPLLDKGALLKSATTVLVHICGGPSMSLYEVEMLMHELSKQVQESAHVLFGAAVDDSMGDNLSITLISALPESLLLSKPSDSEKLSEKKTVKVKPSGAGASFVQAYREEEISKEKPEVTEVAKVDEVIEEPKVIEKEDVPKLEEKTVLPEVKKETVEEKYKPAELDSDNAPYEKKIILKSEPDSKIFEDDQADIIDEPKEEVAEAEELPAPSMAFNFGEKSEEEQPREEEKPKDAIALPLAREKRGLISRYSDPGESKAKPQGELALDGQPKGKFSGEAPNLVDGEDLDLPPEL